MIIITDVSAEQLKRAVPHSRVKYRLSCAEQLTVPDESIDIAVSDHGAFNHFPAPLLLTELRRPLKPNAVLVVCTSSPLTFVCYDRRTGKLGPELLNDYPSSRMRFDGRLVTSELSYADWIRVFSESGFAVERLEEPRPDPDASSYFDELVDVAWASRWPSDIVWVVRKS